MENSEITNKLIHSTVCVDVINQPCDKLPIVIAAIFIDFLIIIYWYR